MCFDQIDVSITVANSVPGLSPFMEHVESIKSMHNPHLVNLHAHLAVMMARGRPRIPIEGLEGSGVLDLNKSRQLMSQT